MGYSSMIWEGTCRWDLISWTIFIQNFAKMLIIIYWNAFYVYAMNFKQILLYNFTLFSKLFSFQANLGNSDWWNWAYFHTKKKKKIWPISIPLFGLNIGHCYARRLIFWPISAVHNWIDLCTKSTPPLGPDASEPSTSGQITWYIVFWWLKGKYPLGKMRKQYEIQFWFWCLDCLFII